MGEIIRRRKHQYKLLLLVALFVACTVAANIVSVKTTQVLGLVFPTGTLLFSITFLCTDVIGEVWGIEEANATVKVGLISNFITTMLIQGAILMPASPFFENQVAYATVLRGSTRILVAGMVTYMVSQHLDVWIFHKLKQRHHAKHLWLRNNLSTLCSQTVDSLMFVFLAFLGTLPLEALLGMVPSLIIVKAFIAILDTPFCYLVVKWCNSTREV